MVRAWMPALLAVAAAGCGAASPTTPASPDAPPTALQGQTVNAVTGAPTGSLSVIVGNYRPVTTDDDGRFSVDNARPGTYPAQIRGASIIERDTTLAPSTDPARLSVIPASFDLTAFDEMFRTSNSRLQRWTSRPALVVLASTMIFRSTGDDQFQAAGEQMTDEEVSLLVAQMTEGLALLTGNTYTEFLSVEVERPAAGERVSVTRTGKIVVGRYTGIVTLASTIGYGRWSEMSDGSISGGAMFLDRDFDRGDARRRLLRIHELGHALGYQHVKSRPSIMNPAIGPEPTDFDRAGAIIAFQRAPGNRSPDVDPSSSTRLSAVAEGGGRWSDAVLCR